GAVCRLAGNRAGPGLARGRAVDRPPVARAVPGLLVAARRTVARLGRLSGRRRLAITSRAGAGLTGRPEAARRLAVRGWAAWCLGAWCLRVWRLAAVVPAEPQPGQAARLSGGVAGRCRGRREGPGLRPGRGRAGFWVGGGLRVRGGTGRRAVPRLIRLVAR